MLEALQNIEDCFYDFKKVVRTTKLTKEQTLAITELETHLQVFLSQFEGYVDEEK